MNVKKQPLSAGLYLVSTPIGTARDITLRALDVLASADVLAAEDTRTARKLMDIHGVALSRRPLVAYHDHSAAKVRARLVDEIAADRSVAYVSEAGTPLIADPGYALARDVREAGFAVTAVPGASAVLAALAVGGLPTDRFFFAGFLPSTGAARKAELAMLARIPGTLVFYEAPQRVREMLSDMCEVLGREREGVVCRELTKRFEETVSGTLGDLADRFAETAPRGEIVVLVGAATEAPVDDKDVEAALRRAMETMRVKDAAAVVAGSLGLPRREVYQAALRLQDED
ncbi:16S rRNA (cytidine(1402)-2'-O)-methyltransferase [Aestuariibius sp. 2305UL40-4]|uniref:16S rRNA (cytidine(1402)-2'-O)-methyltransferase n=1 Tax=Aestuariibius violaceus TaxID=3234132 RepID=UPI00345ED95E